MSDDLRTDFFASGADPNSASGEDARTAFFASGGQTTNPPSAPVTYDAAEFKRRVGRDPEPAELANFKQFKGEGWSAGNGGGSFAGMGEAALATGASTLKGVSHAANDILPNWDDSKAAVESEINTDPILNYRGGPEAQQYLEGVKTLMTPVTWTANKIHQGISGVFGDRAADVAGDIATLIPAARGTNIAGVGRKIVNSMNDPEALSGEGASSLSNSPQSLGAARTAPQIQNASPELQDAIRTTAQQSGGAVNPDALNRQLEADSLPVPMQLTKGQALQDPARLSMEQNLRGQHPEFAARFNEQNGQLVQNLEAIRGQVGPDVFTSNPVDHADTLIDAYKAKDQIARSQIDAAYDSARKSLSPNTPVMDASQLRTNVHQILEDKWATESAPPDIVKRLDALADGNGVITAGQLEGLRTRLADLSRSSDGSMRYAAHLIRGAVEDQNLLPGTESFKAPFDEARGLARARFQAMEADPAYNAAVNGTVPPDRFIQKFIVGGTRDDLARMRANFADNPTATQTMSVAALDHLRRVSGIDDMGNGNFSQANFNKNLQAMAPKFPSLFDHATRENLSTLGNVARYTQFQPRGSFVNNSNTFTAAAAEAGKTALEGAANVAAKGIPVGTWIRKGLQGKAARDFARESLRPGAGIEELQQP